MSGGNPQEKEPDKILPEARLARLREEFARYGRNPFKPGGYRDSPAIVDHPVVWSANDCPGDPRSGNSDFR